MALLSSQSGKRFSIQRYETIPANEANNASGGGKDHNEDLVKTTTTTTDEDIDDELQEKHLEEIRGRRKSSRVSSDYIKEPAVAAFFQNFSLSSPSEDGNDSTTLTSGLSPSSLPLSDCISPTAIAADRGRLYAGRQQQRRRLVFKDGSCNVSSGNVTNLKRKYMIDIFTTLIDMRWRYNLLLFALAFVVSWVLFAVVWYVIAVAHGDHLHPPSSEADAEADEADAVQWQPCVDNVYDFVTALLFSVETQHTIGYGFRAMTPRCPEAVIFLMVQSCTGVFVQCLMTGLIFAKLSQPKKRAHTIMFSQKAVISQQDGRNRLLFRVGDMRRSHFVGTSIRALMVKDRVTKEGECIPLCQYPLEIQTEETNTGDNFVFLVWPVTVVHQIDDKSPLWNVSAEELLLESFEIIVILEGIVESTGMTTQVRTSYLPTEIFWGHVLAPLVTYQKENGQYKIDYTRFHNTIPMQSMPECSARQLAFGGGGSGPSSSSPGAEEDLCGPDSDSSFAGYFTSPVGPTKHSTNRLRVLRLMSTSLKTRRTRRDKGKAEKVGGGGGGGGGGGEWEAPGNSNHQTG